MPAAIGSDEGESPEPEAGLACRREWASSLALREVTKKSCVFFHKAKSIHEFGFLKWNNQLCDKPDNNKIIPGTLDEKK